MYGVGNRSHSHNLIHDAPHIAILFDGNDHLIEYNEIHSVLWEVNDAGAIYAGREWTMRGTVIRYNYLHHVYGPGLHRDPIIWGIYLDDMYSGTTIYGNVFYELTRGARIAGGRDNTIENNVFVNCNPAVEVHSVGVWALVASAIASWRRALTENPFHKRPPYGDRYPGLATYSRTSRSCPRAMRSSATSGKAASGRHVQRVERNHEGAWAPSNRPWEPGDQPVVRVEDNLIDGDRGFVDLAHGNLQLREDSPAYKLGFQRIPMEQIGPYRDPLRASWPVTSTIRPPGPPLPAETATPPVGRTAAPPVFHVPRVAAPIAIDGDLQPAEWFRTDPQRAMVLEQSVDGSKQTPRSLAWLAWDDQAPTAFRQGAAASGRPMGLTAANHGARQSSLRPEPVGPPGTWRSRTCLATCGPDTRYRSGPGS